MIEEEKESLPTAVALQYDGNQAPRVTASGRGGIAEKIMALATGIAFSKNCN